MKLTGEACEECRVRGADVWVTDREGTRRLCDTCAAARHKKMLASFQRKAYRRKAKGNTKTNSTKEEGPCE